ncbi:MAG: hypothetical protein JSU08_19425 [Acidobacteria bacterium]|nr:hypothetical protein [Acidobacteriota bacterium]
MPDTNPTDSDPLGIPLGELFAIIRASDESRTVERVGNAIVVTHDNFTTTIEVVPYEGPQPPDGGAQAVVRIRSVLIRELADALSTNERLALFNRMSTLGALTSENGDVYVGSRLTIFRGEEDAWRLHAVLILTAAETATDSLFGAVRRDLHGEPHADTPSLWQSDDFELAESYLSKYGVCEAGESELVAEFALGPDAVGAAAGGTNTALWQLSAASHPDAGGGLLGILTMPVETTRHGDLDATIADLNRLEMRPVDAPPHFGAWTRGAIDDTVAYCTFLPNLLHDVYGVAVTMSNWAFARAQWASRMLEAGSARPS